MTEQDVVVATPSEEAVRRGEASDCAMPERDASGDTARRCRGRRVVPGRVPVHRPVDAKRVVRGATPASILVLGGGAIGAELAHVYARFDVEVALVEAGQWAASWRPSSCSSLPAAESISPRSVLTCWAWRLRLLDRCPPTNICRVTDGVWAIADVTGRGTFTHVAMYQARIVTADILGEAHTPADYTARWLHPGRRGPPARDPRRRHVDGPDRRRGPGLLTLAVHTCTPIEELRSMIYASPTFHRGIEDALRNLT